MAWEGDEPTPNTTGSWTTGVYELQNIRITNAPRSKVGGAAWDPFGGAADLCLYVYTSDGGDWYCGLTSRHVEDSGTSANLGSGVIMICGPEEYSGDETRFLFFRVYDSDTMDPDMVDESSSISLSDISRTSTNTITCERGAEISFSIEWVGMQ
jgi:hypothetical protein